MIARIWRARTALVFAEAIEAGITEHEIRDSFESVLGDAWIMTCDETVHCLAERHQGDGRLNPHLSLALDRLTIAAGVHREW